MIKVHFLSLIVGSILGVGIIILADWLYTTPEVPRTDGRPSEPKERYEQEVRAFFNSKTVQQNSCMKLGGEFAEHDGMLIGQGDGINVWWRGSSCQLPGTKLYWDDGWTAEKPK